MRLYHYTAVTLAESIFNSGISNGHLTRANGSIFQPIVWLTTDPSPYGHGLPNGKGTVDSRNMEHLLKVQGSVRNFVPLDKTAIRITVEIPDKTPELIAFTRYAEINEPKNFAKITGLSALHRLSELSDAQLKKYMRNSPTKEKTWWLYYGSVHPECIVSVDFNIDGKGKFVPYDFESHGRQIWEKCGLIAASKDSMESLHEILPATNAFDQAKAMVICDSLDSTPTVVFRGGGEVVGMMIDSQRIIKGESTEQVQALASWMRQHRDELLACWEKAVAVYKVYYPDRVNEPT